MLYPTKLWLRRLLLVLAVLVMPLQGIAIASTFVKCHEQAASLAAHDHQHGDSETHHHHGNDEGTSGGMPGHHLCGHFVLHAPASFSLGMQPQFTDWSAAAAFSYTPYFPKHPRRPPRG